MEQQTRLEVARVVRAKRGPLKNASATAALVMLSGAALAPVLAAVAGGAGAAAALAAFAGVAGNVGGGHLTDVIERAADTLRGKSAEPSAPEAIRAALEAELRAALDRNDSGGRELSAGLASLMMSTEGIRDALGAAGDELRDHLLACFWQLTSQHEATLAKLDAVSTEQRRQGRQARRQTALAEEAVDRLRWLNQGQAGRPPAEQSDPAQSGEGLLPVTPAVVAPGGAMTVAAGAGWRGGADVVIGDRVYLIHEGLAEERFAPDHSVVFRQAQGLQQVPAPGADAGYVWLRQAQRDRDSAGARTALSALATERDLLARLRDVRGAPRVAQFVRDEALVSLVLGWPASRSTGAACETLDSARDAGPMDSWRLFRFFAGLAGLCGTLAGLHDRGVAHRYLTPVGIIMLNDGRLVLRDLGLAARGAEPGEGPADYQAPEQRRQARRRPGPRTDVYQLAAVAYHLLTGRPPLARTPLPVRAQAPGVPERAAAALDAALSPEPGVAFTRARRQLVLVGDLETLSTARDRGFRELIWALRDHVGHHGEICSYAEARGRLARLGGAGTLP